LGAEGGVKLAAFEETAAVDVDEDDEEAAEREASSTTTTTGCCGGGVLPVALWVSCGFEGSASPAVGSWCCCCW
jgi:hypothetical protein